MTLRNRKTFFASFVLVAGLAVSSCAASSEPVTTESESSAPTATSASPTPSPTKSPESPSPTATSSSPKPVETTASPSPTQVPQDIVQETVYSSTGTYGITPKGGWTATLNTQTGEPTVDPQVPRENIELEHRGSGTKGAVVIGSYAGGGFHSPGTEVHETLTMEALPHLDFAEGPGYLTEQIISFQNEGTQYIYAAQVVTVRPNDDPMFATALRPVQGQGVGVSISFQPQAFGDAALQTIRTFIDSEARTDALETLRSLEVNQ